MAEIKTMRGGGKRLFFYAILTKIAAVIFVYLAQKKTPPRQYEAGAENTRNIRAIYGDKYKRAVKPAIIAFIAYKM